MAFIQQTGLSFALRTRTVLRLGQMRRFSVSLFSSQAVERNSRDRKAESFFAPTTDDAAQRVTTARPNAPMPAKNDRRLPSQRTITTLDPKRLEPGCFVDISGVWNPSLYILPPDQGPKEKFKLTYCRLVPQQGKHPGKNRLIIQKFPAGTHGFLYYHAISQSPSRFQLRFRVTEDSDPASFSRGYDLVYNKGYLWHLPLSVIAVRPSSDPVQRLLLRDGLIDTQLISDVRNSVIPLCKRLRRPISSLSEPFVADFSQYAHRVMVHTGGQKHLLLLVLPHFDQRNWKSTGRLYESGSALFRFERSTLPQHSGKRVVVLRLLKIIDPPKIIDNPPPMDNRRLPAEGELFMLRSGVWCIDVDKDTDVARVLQVLYDADDGEDTGSRDGE